MAEDEQQEERESVYAFESKGIKYRFDPKWYAVISLIIVFFLYQFVGGGLTLYLFGMIPSADQNTAFRLATMAVEVMFILIPAIFLARIQTMQWKSLLRIRKADWYLIPLAIVGVISLEQFLELYLYVQSLIPLPQFVQRLLDQFQQAIEHLYSVLLSAHNPLEFLFVLLIIGITPAICEETLFRGLVQGNFELSMSRKKAIILTGVIFGLYHMDPFTFVALCSLGIYLSYLVSVSESIIVPMVGHFTNNFISAYVVYATGKDSFIAPSGAHPLSVGYIIGWGAVFALIFGATIALTEKYGHKIQEASTQ